MPFMLVSRPKPGFGREQLMKHLSHQFHPDTWDLIRSGEVTQVLYKTGDEPGFFAILNAPNRETAQAIIDRNAQQLEMFEIEVVPVRWVIRKPNV